MLCACVLSVRVLSVCVCSIWVTAVKSDILLAFLHRWVPKKTQRRICRQRHYQTAKLETLREMLLLQLVMKWWQQMPPLSSSERSFPSPHITRCHPMMILVFAILIPSVCPQLIGNAKSCPQLAAQEAREASRRFWDKVCLGGWESVCLCVWLGLASEYLFLQSFLHSMR